MATRTREQIMGRGYMDAYEEEQKRKAEEAQRVADAQAAVANAGAAAIGSAANEQAANITGQESIVPQPAVTDTKNMLGSTDNGQGQQPVGTQAQKKVSSYDDMMSALYPPETAVERAQREKRQARESMFAGIGDAISAISNMYAATQGVPSTYNPQTTMSASMQRRHDRINAERAKDRQAWMSASMAKDRMDYNNMREARLRQQAAASAMKNEWQRDYNMGMLDVRKAQVENQKAYNEGRISHQEFQDAMAWLNALERWQRNQGSKTVTTGPKGTTTKVTTPNVSIPRPSVQTDNVVYMTEEPGQQQNTTPTQQPTSTPPKRTTKRTSTTQKKKPQPVKKTNVVWRTR